MTNEQKQAFAAKLQQAGIPYESLSVFGALRCNVHVKVISRETAQKWASLLSAVFSGAKVSVVSTIWNAVENKGICMLPTVRKGYLIAVST
jgi:hypothetical protein